MRFKTLKYTIAVQKSLDQQKMYFVIITIKVINRKNGTDPPRATLSFKCSRGGKKKIKHQSKFALKTILDHLLPVNHTVSISITFQTNILLENVTKIVIMEQ